MSERWPATISVPPERFERQVSYLLDKGYVGVTFTEAVTAPPAQRTLAVTFDDGLHSVVEAGFPILQRLGIPATVFVPTAYVGQAEPVDWPGVDHWLHTPYRSELYIMDWQELLALDDAGWEIGSHTRTHPKLPELDDGALADELCTSRLEVENWLGKPCLSVAYPYGLFDARVVRRAEEAGYRAAGALLPGPYLGRGSLSLMSPRVMVCNEDSARRFQRQVTRPMRAAQKSPLWGKVERSVKGVYRAQAMVQSLSLRRTSETLPGSREGAAARVVARRGRLLTARPAVVAGALLSRARLLEAYTLWPSAGSPVLIVPAGDAEVAAWMRRTFESELQRPFGAATWNALRAGALLLPSSEGAAHEAARLALGPVQQRRIACYSVTGASLSKLICFVFEDGAPAPAVAVKLMPEEGEGVRLGREVEYVEKLRQRLMGTPEVTSALPLQPGYAGEVEGEYAVVEPVDPMAQHTGRECRAPAHRWLSAFQEATTIESPFWGSDDLARAGEIVSYAWGRVRPVAGESVRARLEELSADLVGVPVPSCAVHGDFWRGNIAFSEGSLRVYDWEWAQEIGRPFFDLWTFELAELRDKAVKPSYDPYEPLAQAVDRVGWELASRGLPREFARATLVPAIAELTFRIRRATGRPGGNEAGSTKVMAAAERLLLGHADRPVPKC